MASEDCPNNNLEACQPKFKCRGGPCHNYAYDPSDPCPDGTLFDRALCKCTLGNYSLPWAYNSTTNERTSSPILFSVAPYFNGSGDLVTVTTGVVGIPCGGGTAFESTPCGTVQDYQGPVKIEKVGSCSGSGDAVTMCVFTQVNGEYDGGSNCTLQAVNLACSNDSNDVAEGEVGWFFGDTIEEVEELKDRYTSDGPYPG